MSGVLIEVYGTSGASLWQILFETYSDVGPLIGSCTTDSTGWCTFDQLPIGTYTVAATPPPGYFALPPSLAAEVRAGQVSEVYFAILQHHGIYLPLVKKNAP
jgi:hypothetical protein